MRLACILWSLVLAAVAGYCSRVGAGPQIDALRAELRNLEERHSLHVKQLAFASACVTGVHSLQGGWRLIRADGSEAGTITLAASDAEGGPEAALPLRPLSAVSSSQEKLAGFSAAARQPSPQLPQVPVHVVLPPPWRVDAGIVGVTPARAAEDSGNDQKLWPPPVRVTESVLPRPGSSSHRLAAAEISAGATLFGSGVLGAAASLKDTPTLGRLRPELVGSSSSNAKVAAAVHDRRLAADDSEFACQYTGRMEWQEVKRTTVQQLGVWSAGVTALEIPQLRAILDGAVLRLQAVHGFVNECTMGRLCMSVLAVLTGDLDRSLHAAPALHSPLLTILLDTPWSVVIESGWPIFGLLAQMNLHTHGEDDLPSVGREAEFFRGLWAGIQEQTPSALASLAAAFLTSQQQSSIGAASGGSVASAADTDAGGDHAMPILCALSSRLLAAELQGGGAAAEEALGQVQDLYRQSVQSIEDLHASVVSAWPLYSVLHMSALHLNGGAR